MLRGELNLPQPISMYEQWKIADEYSDAGEIVVGDGPKLFSTDHRCYPEWERSWLSLRSQL